MTTVYIIESATGDYEDYCKHFEKAFFDKSKAEDYKNTYNEKLKRDQRVARARRERGLEYDTWIEERHEARITEIEVE
jgi:ribosomal protein L20